MIKKNLRKIKKISSELNNNIFSYILLTQEMILLFLKMEKVLQSDIKESKKEINYYLENVFDRLSNVKNMKDFQLNQKVEIQNFKKEKNHQKLFQDLWIRYNDKQFIEDRFKYYIKRLKKNNIIKFFKAKNCIDFGCGHGQFLMALKKLGAKKCVGIDFGEKNILFANRMRKTLRFNKNKVKFIKGSVYRAPFKEKTFDFAV